MKAVIYTRFSPRRNADESESCEAQEEQCRKHAAEQGWEVRSVHKDEAVSGSEDYKPGLESALAELRRGDVLLVYRRDRLARDVFLAELLRRAVNAKGATICAIHGDVGGMDPGPESVLIQQVLAAVAEYERKIIGQRTSSALQSQQRRGKRVGRYAPYGYMIDPEDDTRIVPNLEEQKALERVLELANEGTPLLRIANTMDAEMPGSSRGKNWSRATIRKIIKRGVFE